MPHISLWPNQIGAGQPSCRLPPNLAPTAKYPIPPPSAHKRKSPPHSSKPSVVQAPSALSLEAAIGSLLRREFLLIARADLSRRNVHILRFSDVHLLICQSRPILKLPMGQSAKGHLKIARRFRRRVRTLPSMRVPKGRLDLKVGLRCRAAILTVGGQPPTLLVPLSSIVPYLE